MSDHPAHPASPGPHITPQVLRWTEALGLGPLFVRRSLLESASRPDAARMPVQEIESRAAVPVHGAPAARPAPTAPKPRSTAQPPATVSPPDSERSSAIARMRWDELEAAAQACRACKLGGSRHQAVFGSGSTQARWMIVGEAPGAEEDRQGEPFVGAAGQLLDAMLHAIGLDRRANDPQHAVYIANVLKCRPPGNRNPEPEEVAQCAPLLQRQIALLQPSLILALGRFAAQSLLGSNAPISQLRSQVHQFAGIPVIVSYHPAYLLRNPADKARVWRDLCFARNTIGISAPA
ncbi:MAG: uracil-DNA glycosylase [Thiomonas sp.]|nr:uracil-DNA glycosylase [Thiomonas sp.]